MIATDQPIRELGSFDEIDLTALCREPGLLSFEQVRRLGHRMAVRFAAAHDSDPGRAVAGELLGTARYASPEEIAGTAVTGVSDVFSLGAVMYELLAGHPPFMLGEERMDDADPEEEQRAPELDTGLAPNWTRSLIERMLSKNPLDRPTMQSVRNTLKPIDTPGTSGGMVDDLSWLPIAAIPSRRTDDARQLAQSSASPAQAPPLADGWSSARLSRSPWIRVAVAFILIGALGLFALAQLSGSVDGSAPGTWMRLSESMPRIRVLQDGGARPPQVVLLPATGAGL